jgi:hypothetical protein
VRGICCEPSFVRLGQRVETREQRMMTRHRNIKLAHCLPPEEHSTIKRNLMSETYQGDAKRSEQNCSTATGMPGKSLDSGGDCGPRSPVFSQQCRQIVLPGKIESKLDVRVQPGGKLRQCASTGRSILTSFSKPKVRYSPFNILDRLLTPQKLTR